MSEALKKSKPMTSEDSPNAISSLASECGVTPCVEPDGQTMLGFGRGHVPAHRSHQQGRRKPAPNAVERTLCHMLDELAISYAAYAVTNGSPTPGTYGRKCGGLSETDALDIFLGNRLQEKMEEFGSRLFVLRWKYWDMPLGRRVLAQRASGRRTSGSDYISWPTPSANQFEIASEERLNERRRICKERYGNGNGFGLTTSQAARLAAWPTPQKADGDRGSETMMRGNLTLKGGAKLASWATPRSVEAGHSTGNPGRAEDKKSRLEDQVFLASPESRVPSPDPVTASGPTPNGFGAAMGSGGQLNPRHSAWLMGLPIVWDECALRVEKKSSSRSSRKAKTESEG